MTTLMTIEGLGKIVAIPHQDFYFHPGLGENIHWKDVQIALIKEDESEQTLAIVDWEELYGLRLIPFEKDKEELDHIWYGEGNREGYRLGNTRMEMED